jgi:hypothetical protein
MKQRTLISAAAVLAFSLAGLSFAQDQFPDNPQKRKGPVPRTDAVPPELASPVSGALGSPGAADRTALKAQIDATMERMARRVEESQALAESFANLAELHHGADRSEILMMQRMSETMGTMAGEVGTSLAQYKKMLDDETASESGNMKAEVQSLKTVTDVIAAEIDQAITTLQKLQLQLGQG